MKQPSRVNSWSMLLFFLHITRVASQDYCNEFVNGGDLTISQPVRAAVEEQQITFQELVDCLQDGDSLTFEASSLALETLRISSAITIRTTPEASTSLACLDGPIFIINADGVSINSLEISGCRLDSADAPVVLRSGRTLELNSVNFTNNRNRVGSASLRMGRGSRLVINKCSFHRNNSTEANVLATSPGCEVIIQGSRFRGNRGEGSTLSVADGNQLNISNSRFTNNQATRGGGVIRIESRNERTSVVIDDASEFRNNEAVTEEGGAIFAIGSVSLLIREETMFIGNRAANQGGALFIIGAATVRIEDAYFVENESLFLGGGAIFAENSTFGQLEIEISNTFFSENAARNQLGSGGAIRLQGTGVRCVLDNGVSFISNHAELDGGAVHISNVLSMIVREASFIGNEAHQGGAAALYVVSTMNVNFDIMVMNVSIESCLFLFNKAVTSFRGGGTLGFVGARTEVAIEGSRFHENECPVGSGAAVYIFEGPVITISSSSFSNNRAIWGGAIYAEMDCKCDISNSIFFGNNAEEGGAISTRNAVDLDVMDSQFMNNSATEDGGAVKSEHHALSRGSASLFTFTNCEFENNNAGSDLAEIAVHSISTRGGGILVIGRGQYVRIIGNTFRNNSASEGGGIAAIGPRQFTLTELTRFEANVANFGGGIFTIVDNSVDIFGGQYVLDGVQFVNNTADGDGGGIRVRSFNSNNVLFSFNAVARTVTIRNTVFQTNRAIRVGGGLAADGVGLRFQHTTFLNNSAISASRTSAGQGGALALTDGASARVEASSLSQNQASDRGGGVFVKDSSLSASSFNFSSNSVNGVDGKGGAVALELTSNRLIPTLVGGARQRNILLECNDCYFSNNSAPLQGGAVYHYHSDPNANYTATHNCENNLAVILGSYEGAEEYNLTCAWIQRARRRLENRIIRLSRVQFSGNEALTGAALFTNYPAMINITDGSEASDGDVFLEALQSSTVLSEAGIIFTSNIISEGGYGPDYASYPVHAFLFSNEAVERQNGSSTLTFPAFRSGDRVRFYIQFQDAFGQPVSTVANFSGEIIFDKNKSGNSPLELSGQTSGRLDQEGRMRFTGTKLAGITNITYLLRMQFLLEGRDLAMEDPLNISITMRPCRVGEFTRTDGEVIECIDCPAGTFNSKVNQPECKSCERIDGGRCFGRAVIPEDHYWHSSSFSLKTVKCIDQEACIFKDRFSILNTTETEAHLRGEGISYTDGNNTQCAEGYEGILCGSCASGYGRQVDMCRKCASRGVRFCVLLILVLWAIAFLGYFVRSVIELSARVEFNKKFGQQANESVQGCSPPVEHLPTSSTSLTIVEEGSEITTNPVVSMQTTSSIESTRRQATLNRQATPHDVTRAIANEVQLKRQETRAHTSQKARDLSRPSTNRRQTHLATKLQQLQRDPAKHNVELLTLGNPVSEVLKILINFLQVTSMAVSINVDWTHAVRRTLFVLGSAGNLAGGTGYFSIDCFLGSRSVPKSLRRMVIAVLYPLVIFLLFVFFWAIRALLKHQTKKCLLQRFWLSFLCIYYFFYIGMTKDLLRFFACVTIDEDAGDLGETELAHPLEDSYWAEDTSVKCYSHRHALIVGILVIPSLLAVSFGYPLGTFFILQSNKDKLDQEDVIGTYGFLYRGYDKHYWEILVMLRKGLIATVAVFAYDLGENIQGLICVLILVASLALHLTFMPFTKEFPQLNDLETGSLSTTIVVFVSGLIFNDPKCKLATEVLLSIITIFLIVATLFYLLVALISSSEEVIDMLLLENKAMECDELCYARLSLKVERLVLHYLKRVQTKGQRILKLFCTRKEPVNSQTTSIPMRGL